MMGILGMEILLTGGVPDKKPKFGDSESALLALPATGVVQQRLRHPQGACASYLSRDWELPCILESEAEEGFSLVVRA